MKQGKDRKGPRERGVKMLDGVAGESPTEKVMFE